MVPFPAVPPIVASLDDEPATHRTGRCNCAECDARAAIDDALDRVGAELVTIVRRAKKHPRWKVGIALTDDRGISSGEGPDQSTALLQAIQAIDATEREHGR